MSTIDKLKFDSNGLIPAIIQDDNGRVLMLGYMNRESIEKCFETGLIHFWSRSRKKLWKKGETSGHVQKIIEVRIDCDMDALLFVVKQECACCHEGYYSCFWRKLEGENWKIVDEKIFNPERIYK
ncbi:MAG TPA: phosphoribosyl-AMP cyclohydrolase [bacterium]|nr:phosphoribosyl-AMP cyclohydrolase [bacterium]